VQIKIKIETDGSPSRTHLRDAVSGKKLRLVQELTLKVDLHGSTLRFTQNGYRSPALRGRRIDGEYIFEEAGLG
jgi:hypothetical protein